MQSPLVQAKLKIGSPDDEYEREANRVADQVMSMLEPKVQRTCPKSDEKEEKVQSKPIAIQITPLVQRRKKTGDGEEEEKIQTKPIAEQITPLVQRQAEPEEEEETIQRKAPAGIVRHVSSGVDIEAGIRSLNGNVQPLPESERTYFEPRFKNDFSSVRIHSDPHARVMAKALSARAFTIGQDIVFGAGEYMPGTERGRRLLAHELIHVVQRGSIVRMKSISGMETSRLVDGSGLMSNDEFVSRKVNRGLPNPSARNAVNLVFTINGHRPGIQYNFKQTIHERVCMRNNPSMGESCWVEARPPRGPREPDSPAAFATCRIPDARGEIAMADAPGFRGFDLHTPGPQYAMFWEEAIQRMNAITWLRAKQKLGKWKNISKPVNWHSVSAIRRDAAGNWQLAPKSSQIGLGHIGIKKC